MNTAQEVELLAYSALFEGIEADHVRALADLAIPQAFAEGEAIVIQGEEAAEALFVLEHGEVRISYTLAHAGQPLDEEEGARPPLSEVVFTARERGYPLGWSAAVDPNIYRATVTASTSAQTLRVDRPQLEAYAQAHPDFALAFARRALWLAGARLGSVRLRLVANRLRSEREAIGALLTEYAPSLPVTSPLHHIPPLLGHRLTVDTALTSLDALVREGDRVEREIGPRATPRESRRAAAVQECAPDLRGGGLRPAGAAAGGHPPAQSDRVSGAVLRDPARDLRPGQPAS